MTRYQLGAMIVRTIAVFYLLRTVSILILLLPLITKNSSEQMDSFLWNMHGTTLMINVALVVILWLAAKPIGRLVAGKEPDAPVSVASAETYMPLVFVGAGCLFLGQAIPETSQLVAFAMSEAGQYKSREYQLVQKGLSVGLYVGLSMLFIFGAKALSKLVAKARAAGK